MKISVSPMQCVIGREKAEKAGEKGYHFPSAEILSDGSVYLIARHDTGMDDPWGTTEAVRWFPETGELRPMPSPTAYDLAHIPGTSAYMCYVTEFAPNELVALYGLVTPGDHPTMFDTKTFGGCPNRLRLTRSHDNGLTWDVPEDIAYQTKDNMIPSKIYSPKPGIWGFHVEMHNLWEEDYREPIQARFVYSVDGGRTFDRCTFIPHPEDFLAGDCRTTMDGKGNICAFFWGFDLKTMKDLAVYRSFSHDGGMSFSPVEPISLHKQITSPFYLDDTTYMALYQERFSEKPGLYAALSYDGGMTWDEKNAVGIFVKGNAPKSANAFEDIDEAYTFGYSTLTRLGPNKALATFWNANGGSTCISVCEITVE